MRLERLVTYGLLLEVFEDVPDGWLAALPSAGSGDPLASDAAFVDWLVALSHGHPELVTKARRIAKQFRDDRPANQRHGRGVV